MMKILTLLLGLNLLFMTTVDGQEQKQAFHLGFKPLGTSYLFEFVEGENLKFYDYLATRLNLGANKQGQYPHEKYLVSYKYTASGELDSVVVNTTLGAGLYRNELERCFNDVDLSYDELPNADGSYSLVFRVSVWEETGELSLQGLFYKHAAANKSQL